MAQIVKDKPPIWDAVKANFDFDPERTIFSWGDIIYNPGGIEVDKFLEAHEGVHQMQQEQIGGPHPWWDRYIKDPAFRAKQEAEAYGVQYALFCRTYSDRTVRARYLNSLVHDLSGGMYKLSMLPAEAKLAILQRA